MKLKEELEKQLKPCPFCGSTNLFTMLFKADSLGNSSSLLITCKDCKNQTTTREYFVGKKRGIEERLVERWNRRV